MYDQTDAVFSDAYIDYTAAQINSIASHILVELRAAGAITIEEADVCKIYFNTVLDMLINNKDDADDLLAQDEEESEEEMSEEDRLEEEAWNELKGVSTGEGQEKA